VFDFLILLILTQHINNVKWLSYDFFIFKVRSNTWFRGIQVPHSSNSNPHIARHWLNGIWFFDSNVPNHLVVQLPFKTLTLACCVHVVRRKNIVWQVQQWRNTDTRMSTYTMYIIRVYMIWRSLRCALCRYRYGYYYYCNTFECRERSILLFLCYSANQRGDVDVLFYGAQVRRWCV
jgi:hypothetical protein